TGWIVTAHDRRHVVADGKQSGNRTAVTANNARGRIGLRSGKGAKRSGNDPDGVKRCPKKRRKRRVRRMREIALHPVVERLAALELRVFSAGRKTVEPGDGIDESLSRN